MWCVRVCIHSSVWHSNIWLNSWGGAKTERDRCIDVLPEARRWVTYVTFKEGTHWRRNIQTFIKTVSFYVEIICGLLSADVKPSTEDQLVVCCFRRSHYHVSLFIRIICFDSSSTITVFNICVSTKRANVISFTSSSFLDLDEIKFSLQRDVIAGISSIFENTL